MQFTINPGEQISTIIEINNYSTIFVLSDSNTYLHCLPVIQNYFPAAQTHFLTVTAGEITKNIDTCIHLWNELNAQGADRRSLLISLGGGMITDLGGFVGSTYKRGIDFIHIPTSMLGIIDASAGGKNGINLGALKNQVGVIRQPREVIVYPGFLATLDRRNYLSGYAEALKHALLMGKEAFEQTLQFVNPEPSSASFLKFLEKNITIKLQIVERDPHEKGDRKALNFGHTIGHAIEALSYEQNQPLLHGEAIALGMVGELYLSAQIVGFPEKFLKKYTQFIAGYYEKPKFENSDFECLIEYMKQDKKNFRGRIQFTLLEKIGKYAVDQPIEVDQIKNALHYIFEGTSKT